jgi:indoleacetamide hydrolase
MRPATAAGGQRSEPAANEVLEWTACEAVNHIRRGSITAERYASQLLQRYRETRDLNAVTWIDEDRVLELARSVDAARSRRQTLGPLAGLPIVIKDNISTVGFPTTAGVSVLRDFYPQRNARVAEILFENGAILLGKANMDELGRGFTNSNAVYGFAKNPYDISRVPGGGAGGTATAISARITPAGLGSDTAGSARIPASWCGIAGMRPSTAGRLKGWTVGSWTVTTTEDGIFPISFAVTTPAPMGRTVSDVALLNSVVTGTSMPAASTLRGTRIGVPRGFYWEDVEPEVLRVSEEALRRLRDAGAILIDVNLRTWAQTAIPTFFTLATMHGFKDVADFLERNGSKVTVDEIVKSIRSKDILAFSQRILNNPVTPEAAEAAVKTRLRLAHEYQDLFRRENVSALVYPTVPVLAPPIRPQGDEPTDTIELNGKQVNQFNTAMRNTHVSGVVGIPSVNIPVGLSLSGLPVGLSFSGLADSDSKLLGLGLSIEAAFGRLPVPTLRTSHSAPPPTPPPTTSPPPSASPQPQQANVNVDNVDRVFALLKQSAYLNLFGRFDLPEPDRAGAFTAQAPLRRYDVDFRINGCGTGMHGVNLLGEECGRAELKWTFRQGGASGSAAGAREFMLDDLFVFDDEGRNRLRGAGNGRLVPSLFSDSSFGVQANVNIVEGTGVFAGVQGSYVLTGSCERSRLNIHFTMRLMDPTGLYQTPSELRALDGTHLADRLLTAVALLGEPDPEHPVELRPTGARVHELLRAVHTDFDRGRGSDRLRSNISLGPIIARWQTDVIFNPADPSAPGTADRPMPVRLENVKITFLEGSGTLEASITDGRGFAMTFPGVSGPLFRMTGFGPLGRGTERFRNARGVISMLGALELMPSTFSNYYLLHIVDPEGCFRC